MRGEPSLSALATYLRELDKVHSSGAAVPETSYYPALSTLLNEVGGSVRPKVHCVINPRNLGGGIPDGGLYLDSQIKNNPQVEGLNGPRPAQLVQEMLGHATISITLDLYSHVTPMMQERTAEAMEEALA